MTPMEKYRHDLKQEGFNADPAQANAVQHTQRLYEDLLVAAQYEPGLITRIKKTLGSGEKSFIKGLYFWGGVGRGKTYLVDAFFQSLPFEEKKRIHFHRFMQFVHHQLKKHKKVQNPLDIIAAEFSEDTYVLCFDEFHVTDITDAMLLAGLLKSLFERGVVLVATSNEAPDELYSGGLQRARFLPAIDLIKEYTEVVNVDSGTDYRLRYLDRAEIYHHPLDERAQSQLRENFQRLAPDEGIAGCEITIEGRTIPSVYCADGVIWFDFRALCDGPRGPADYIEIARQYQTVLLANCPVMTEQDNDRAKRFMTMIDEFYDRNVKLIITAADAPEKIYQGKRHAKGFQRTISRLQEMQTHDYLAKQHLS